MGVALGQRLVSFKLWRRDGLLADATNEALVGKRFELTENLALALARDGEVRADLEQTGDAEDVAEDAMGVPLLEIYTPIRDVQTGDVIAVAAMNDSTLKQIGADLSAAVKTCVYRVAQEGLTNA